MEHSGMIMCVGYDAVRYDVQYDMIQDNRSNMEGNDTMQYD